MAKTSIEWTATINSDGTITKGRVWNPVTGCTKVSQGCKHCYAETIANRFWSRQYPPNPDGSPRKFTDVRIHPGRIDEPLKWKKSARVFVNSMSDLFHPEVPLELIVMVWQTMARAHWHTFMVLTKRPRRMLEYFTSKNNWGVLPNVWLGVSAENQQTADERIPLLLQTPAAVRFVSCEPLLGNIDLTQAMYGTEPKGMNCFGFTDGYGYEACLQWIIAGCESGAGARNVADDAFRGLRDQCTAAGIPFFLKQMMVNGKLVKLPELDGQVWAQFPEARP